MVRLYGQQGGIMAIGDAFGLFMGTGAVTRQPASGVEEQVSYCGKSAGSDDAMYMYDGTNSERLFYATINTGTVDINHASQTPRNAYNLAVMITNTFYLSKTGTTDKWFVGGVQTNA